MHVPAARPRAGARYRVPNDRVLRWAQESDGRLYPYCRLDPAQDPVGEAERCLALGARGIKLHPRAQAFGFGDDAAESIWKVADEARVPILIHAGRGMPPMDPLADLALRYPDVPLVLAHAAIADQGMFASRLADHPNVVYDTSTFSVFDQIELFARVPAERIVFASDVPYGRPLGAMHAVLRIAAYAGLNDDERRSLVGRTMTDILERRPLAAPSRREYPDPPGQRSAHAGQRLPVDGFCRRAQQRTAARLQSRRAVHRARAGGMPRSRSRHCGARARADR